MATPQSRKVAGRRMPDRVVAEELELLERISRRLAEIGEPRVPSEAPLVQDLRGLREEILARREGKDSMALHEQWHRQSALLQQLRSSREAPRVDPRSPYFGHLRLRESGRERDLCLGRATRIEDGVRIVDWRHAPVSKLFYRYDQGDDYEEEIAGRVRVGEVLARRTVSIRDALLERVEAPEGVFTVSGDRWERVSREPARLAGGEGAALRAHSAAEAAGRQLGTDLRGAQRRSDKRLPEITGLIDPTQFDLITRERAGFLAIRGAAGSGKTTVALHRIAYLAYDDPEIDSEQTLFVVFSEGLRRYVGHVLPALGVRSVAIRTFADWATEQRRRHFPRLPHETRQDTPASVQRIKLHPALGAALEAQAQRVSGRPDAEQALDDWASVRTQPALLAEHFARLDAGIGEPELASFCDWSRRQNEELNEVLEGDGEVTAVLDPEDDALLLRAWQLRVGRLRSAGRHPVRYRHVAIDEVQDFSPLEVQVLADCLDDSRSLTLAGDTQQHVVESSGFTSWSDFLARLGVSGDSIETLRVSYRSSREIVSFARALLGDLAEDDEPPVAKRSGPAVELFRFTDRGACVVFLADALRRLAEAEPLASVAVLTPSREVSALYAEGLIAGDVPRLRQVERQDFTFLPGVEVTEIDQAKGLEFDYVVVVDVSGDHFPESPGTRRLLHVASTRAVHQLWLACVGTPSPLLRDIAS
jgi:DNA helicase-2/ATP-dependent DNA helicase PcrA